MPNVALVPGAFPVEIPFACFLSGEGALNGVGRNIEVAGKGADKLGTDLNTRL